MPSTYEQLQKVAQSDHVRGGLRVVRDRIASRARAIDAQNGANSDITVSEGTRPAGRPYARVSAASDQEYGNPRVARRRTLGRAARS